MDIFENYVTQGVVHHNSSKSHALAMEVLWTALGVHPWQPNIAPCEIWYATQRWEDVGKILYKQKLKPLLQGIPHNTTWHNMSMEVPKQITIPTEWGVSTITLKAYEQGRGSFQGTAVPLIAFDEQFPADVFEESISRIGAGIELRFATAFTPIDSQPWLEEPLTTKMPADWELFECPLDDNRISRGGFIADAEIDALIARWPEEVQATRRLGKWGGHQGLIFQSFSRNVHVIDEPTEAARFLPGNRLPHHVLVYRGIDWGGANPMALVWACRLPSLHNDWYVFDEYYWDSRARGMRSLEDHAQAVHAIDQSWGAQIDRTWADHDPTDAFEFGRYGVPSWPADKKDGLRPSIELIQTLLKTRDDLGRPRLFVARRCENLIREMLTYHYPGGTDTKNPKEEPVDKDNHAISALRYLLYSENFYGDGQNAGYVEIGGDYARAF